MDALQKNLPLVIVFLPLGSLCLAGGPECGDIADVYFTLAT
jgi:hypothetical protein